MKNLLLLLLLIIWITGCERQKSETTPSSSIPIEIIEKCKALSNDSIPGYHLIKSESYDYWVKAGNGTYSIDYNYSMGSLGGPILFIAIVAMFFGLFLGAILFG